MGDKLIGGAALAALMLLLLVFPALIEGPEAAAPLPPAPGPRLAAILAAPTPQGEAAEAAARSGPSLRPEVLIQGSGPQAFAPLRDSNGHPLLRRAYVKTVYRAFPPERWPG